MVQPKTRRLVTEDALQKFVNTQAAEPVATLAALPAASSANRGLIRFVTAENEPYYSNGTAWSSIAQGAQGEPGPAGAGVPDGGAALQVIRKNSVGTTTEWATPTKAMVGLTNVDNTADANKPISSAMQSALDEKASATSLTNGLNGKADLSNGKVPVSQLPTDALVTDASVDGVNKNLIEDPASLTAGALSATIDQSIDVQTAHLATATESLTEYSVSSGPIPFLYGAPIFTTETVGTASTIAGGTYIERTNANLRYEGLNLGDTGSHYYFQALTGSGTGSNPWRVSFDFDGGEFEMRAFRASSNYGGYRVWIDGNPSTPTMPGLTNSGNSMVKLTLPSTQRRRITLEFDRGFNFAGFWIPAGASVTPSSTPNPKRLAIVGDSYVWGAGIAATSQNAMGFPQSLGRLMGWPQVANFGVGGSGYVVPGSGGGKYGDPARMDALTTFAPDIVLITGSQNDRLNTDAQIKTEAEALFAAIKAALPSAQIIATSMLFAAEPTYLGGGFTIERRASMDAAIKAATVTAGVEFIDASTWFNGTGRLGEPVGDGNADLFRSAIDWNHPSQDGHDFIARRLAPEIRRLTGA